MTVTVVHLRYVDADFRCDRTSKLGNPFRMTRAEDRDKVCDQYEDYFQENMNPDKAPVGFLRELDKILQYAKTHDDVTLGCWCAPKRCHCDTIKRWLDYEISKQTD